MKKLLLSSLIVLALPSLALAQAAAAPVAAPAAAAPAAAAPTSTTPTSTTPTYTPPASTFTLPPGFDPATVLRGPSAGGVPVTPKADPTPVATTPTTPTPAATTTPTKKPGRTYTPPRKVETPVVETSTPAPVVTPEPEPIVPAPGKPIIIQFPWALFIGATFGTIWMWFILLLTTNGARYKKANGRLLAKSQADSLYTARAQSYQQVINHLARKSADQRAFTQLSARLELVASPPMLTLHQQLKAAFAKNNQALLQSALNAFVTQARSEL